MKVAHISPTFFGKGSVIGGGERYALELSRRMARQVTTALFTFSQHINWPVVEWEGDLEIRTYPVSHFLKGNLANPLSIAFLKDLRTFDILHCYGYPTAVTDLCSVFSKVFRKKLFVTDIHGGGICLSTYLSKLGMDTRCFIDGFLQLSAYNAQQYKAFQEKMRIIYGGVDMYRFQPLEVLRDRRVLFVGRLIPIKGLNYLIEAIDSSIPLRVVGQPYDERYFRHLQTMAKGKEVEFLTTVSDSELLREYASALVTVVPSVYTDMYGNRTPGELFNLVALESMACETPVIATSCGGLPEVVEDGVTGFLVPPNDPKALREKIDFYLACAQKTKEMGEAGRKRVLQYFTWDLVVARCLKAYQEALQ